MAPSSTLIATAPTPGTPTASTPSAPPLASAPGSPRMSTASSAPVPETSSGYSRMASATARSGDPGGADTSRRYAPASPLSDSAYTGAPQPSTPAAATGSPVTSSTVARSATWSGCVGSRYPVVGQPAARHVA